MSALTLYLGAFTPQCSSEASEVNSEPDASTSDPGSRTEDGTDDEDTELAGGEAGTNDDDAQTDQDIGDTDGNPRQPGDASVDGNASADGGAVGPHLDDAASDVSPDALEEPSTAPFRSGSRLRAVTFDDGTGLSAIVTFFDTERGKLCGFQPNVDGDRYCFNAGFSLPYFVDADCTMPVVSVDSECSPFELGDVVQVINPRDQDPCGPVSHYLFAEAELSPAQLYTVSFDDGSCASATPNPDATYYEATEVDWSTFVAGTERDELVDTETELAVRYIDGEDGSSVHTGYTLEGEHCTARELDASGTLRCFDGTDRFYTYAGPSCTDEPAVPISETCSGLPKLIALMEDDAEGCTVATGIFEPGDLSDGPVYIGSEASCNEVELRETEMLLHPGAEVPVSSLPAIDTFSSGEGRLQRLGTSAGGQRASTGHWFDTELDIYCEPRLFTDGAWRCFPRNTPQGGQYYSDPDCTVSLYDSAFSSCGGSPEFGFTVETDFGHVAEVGRCDFTLDTEVRRLELYSGSVYEMSEECEEVTPGAPLYEDVGEVDVDQFYELTLETE